MTAKLALFITVLATCFSAAAETLTLYSHRHYQSDSELFERFTEKTGIEVKVVKASADELIERLKAEGENSPADILIAADAGRLQRAKAAGVLQPLSSEILFERIPAAYRDPDNTWFGFTLRARVFAYAADRVDASELGSYEDLANKNWRGRLLIRSSANIYNQSLLASMLAHHGEEKAQAWAAAVRKNMARPPQGSDRDQMRAVAAGLGDLAVVNTYYVGLLLRSDNPKDREVARSLSIHFPNQDDRGTHVNVSGAGMARHSPNPEAALKFLEFLSSDEAQKTFPQTTSEYPVVGDVPWSDLQLVWGEFKKDSLNLNTLGNLNTQAVQTFNKAGWE